MFSCEWSDDSNDSASHNIDSARRLTDSAHHSGDSAPRKRHTRRRQHEKRRRRIVHVIDSSTEDDLDIDPDNDVDALNNNNEKPTDNRVNRSNIPQSAVQNNILHSAENNPVLTTSELTELCQPNYANRTALPLKTKAGNPAEYSGSVRFSCASSLIRSGQSKTVSAAVFPDGFSRGVDQTVDLKSVENSQSLLNSVSNTATAGKDVATFSLAFDEFLDSECEEEFFDDGVTEYTRLRDPKDTISALLKPDNCSLDVSSCSQVGELCRSGQSALIRSGESCSVMRSEHSGTAVSAPSWSCGSIVSQSNYVTGSGQTSLAVKPVTSLLSRSATSPSCHSTTGSGHRELSGSQRPRSITNETQSEAERLREERLRMSRLKKEEFQRKYRASTQSAMNSPSVGISGPEISGDWENSTLRIFVDSRELAGAQVRGWTMCVVKNKISDYETVMKTN